MRPELTIRWTRGPDLAALPRRSSPARPRRPGQPRPQCNASHEQRSQELHLGGRRDLRRTTGGICLPVVGDVLVEVPAGEELLARLVAGVVEGLDARRGDLELRGPDA